MTDTMMSSSGAIAVRRMLFGLGGILSSIVLGLFLLPYLLPASVEKSIVSSVLEKAFQRPVIISGDVAFSVLPNILLSANNIVVPAAENTELPVLVDIASLQLEVGAVPLLSNVLDISRLSIDQPVFRFSRDQQGRTNWQAYQAANPVRAIRKPDFDWGWWHDLKIGDVRLNDGRLVFDDRLLRHKITGQNLVLRASISRITGADDGLSVDGGMDINGEAVRLQLDLGSMKRFLSGGRMPVIAELSAVPLTVRYQGTMAKRQYVVTEGQVSVDTPSVKRVEDWLGRVFARPVSGGLDWKFRFFANGNRTAFDDIRLEMGNGRYSGNLRLDAGSSGYRMDGVVSATNMDFGALSNVFSGIGWLDGVAGGVRLGWRKASFGDLKFDEGELRIALLPEKQRIELDLIRMAMYGGRASGLVKIVKREGMTSIDANVEVSRINSGNLLAGLRASASLMGDANIRLGLFSVGSSTEEMLAALRGNGEFNIIQGAVKSASLAEHLRVANRDALGFSQLIGSFSIDRGIVEGRDLLLKAEQLSLVGDGLVDLSSGEVNIHLQSLSRAREGSGKNIQKVRPFRMQGTLAEIEIFEEEG